jgi:hypothetical protein
MLMNAKSPGDIGHAFERQVLHTLEKNGYIRLGLNRWITNYAPERDGARKREYDLVMFRPVEKQFYIIECKAHFSSDAYVGMGLVREFAEKLRNNNGSHARRMMVTDTDYTTAARRYALNNSISLINGRELSSMERSTANPLRILARRIMLSSIDSLASKLMSEIGGGR